MYTILEVHICAYIYRVDTRAEQYPRDWKMTLKSISLKMIWTNMDTGANE